MMFAVDKAKVIRAELKKLGINARMVSVTSRDAGYEERIDIKIKSPAVDIEKVKAVALHFEDIDRDERTGEILAGGNTFVFVRYADDAYSEVIKPLMKQADDLMQDAAFEHVTPITDNISLICEGDKFIARDNRAYDRRYCYSVEDVAKLIYNVSQYDHI